MPAPHPLKDCMGAVLAESRETVLRGRDLPTTKVELARMVSASVSEIHYYEGEDPERQRFGSDRYLRHVAELAGLRKVPEITLWEEALESWRFARDQAESVGESMLDADDEGAA